MNFNLPPQLNANKPVNLSGFHCLKICVCLSIDASRGTNSSLPEKLRGLMDSDWTENQVTSIAWCRRFKGEVRREMGFDFDRLEIQNKRSRQLGRLGTTTSIKRVFL